MNRLIEIILGLDKGFLSREGEFSIGFNPRWPLQDVLGAATWNALLLIIAVAVVVYVYRREARSRTARILLGGIRLALLLFVIAMLNRPVVTLRQSRVEPSVLAVMVDNSVSMSVRDAGKGPDGRGRSRFDAAMQLLSGDDAKLLRDLARHHEIRIYSFDRDARPVAKVPQTDEQEPTTNPSEPLVGAFANLKAAGQATQVLASLRSVLQELQGKRVAGVVMITDGRDSPSEPIAEIMPHLLTLARGGGTRIYPVVAGSDKPPQNITVEGIDLQDAAFARDIVRAKVRVRAVGYEPGHTVEVVLRDKASGLPLTRSGGALAKQTMSVTGDAPQEIEVNFQPSEVGTLQILAEAIKQPGEIDDQDNVLPAQIAVLDAKINLLYCEGYPRWEYRYLKNEMIRDRTVDISCLLFSADTGFAQEGDRPITRFPESLSEMLAFDVVIFGDVDPRQFTDAQLQLVSDFVSRYNGGFGMVAGPRYAPYAYRNTPVEAVLPVSVPRISPEEPGVITAGWRPVLTREGEASTIFRFLEDKQENARFLVEEIQPLFWYAQSIGAKPGVGEVYAEHPEDMGPDGQKAPILVLGRFGGGRTLFSAIDDSWRWRFYTGESVFDTYWVQQIRYLARARKLGQRRFTFTTLRPGYELGEQVQASLRVLDPELLRQLPDQLDVMMVEQTESGEQPVRRQTLVRQTGQQDLYVASWTADRVGRFALQLPGMAGVTQADEVPIAVSVPRLELLDPRTDPGMLSKLRDSDDPNRLDPAKLVLTDEQSIPQVRGELLKIASAAQNFDILTHELLWNAPLALLLFVLLISGEWILRKAYGML